MKTQVKEKPNTAEKVTQKTQKKSPPQHAPHDDIALRAYHIWLERGCSHGGDGQDWLQAEQELQASGSA